MRQLIFANSEDKDEILKLYKMQLGREFCPWTESYPVMDNIEFDLERNNLLLMKEDSAIIATISIDEDELVDSLECWTKELRPGGELARLAVYPDYQNQGIARKMIEFAMEVLTDRDYKSVHYLVNKHNTKALRSYEHLGFKKVGECFLYEEPFWCYEKELLIDEQKKITN